MEFFDLFSFSFSTWSGMIMKYLLLSWLSSGQIIILAHCSHCSHGLQISYLWCSFHILASFRLIVHIVCMCLLTLFAYLWIFYSSFGNLRVFDSLGTWFIHIICILLTFRASNQPATFFPLLFNCYMSSLHKCLNITFKEKQFSQRFHHFIILNFHYKYFQILYYAYTWGLLKLFF